MSKLQPLFEMSDETVLLNLHTTAVEDAMKACRVDSPDYDIVNSMVTDENGNAVNIKARFKIIKGKSEGEIAIIKKFEDFSGMDDFVRDGDWYSLKSDIAKKKLQTDVFKGITAYLRAFAGEDSTAGLNEDDLENFIPYQGEKTVRSEKGKLIGMPAKEFEKWLESHKDQHLKVGFKISFKLS